MCSVYREPTSKCPDSVISIKQLSSFWHNKTNSKTVTWLVVKIWTVSAVVVVVVKSLCCCCSPNAQDLAFFKHFTQKYKIQTFCSLAPAPPLLCSSYSHSSFNCTSLITMHWRGAPSEQVICTVDAFSKAFRGRKKKQFSVQEEKERKKRVVISTISTPHHRQPPPPPVRP